jgi:hypothetical protein
VDAGSEAILIGVHDDDNKYDVQQELPKKSNTVAVRSCGLSKAV